MIRKGWFRIPVLVLVLALISLPALGGQQPAPSSAQTGFWQACAESIARIGSELRMVFSALGTVPDPNNDPDGGNSGDLGPGLDPAG